MTRKKTSAGGFYSYISHGLGRQLGIGTGYGAVVAYSVFEAVAGRRVRVLREPSR